LKQILVDLHNFCRFAHMQKKSMQIKFSFESKV
jgi:hypothetical protein